MLFISAPDISPLAQRADSCLARLLTGTPSILFTASASFTAARRWLFLGADIAINSFSYIIPLFRANCTTIFAV